MFKVIKETTPSEARGWFALSVPISKPVAEQLDVASIVGRFGETPAAFRQVAANAQGHAVGEISGEELLSAATLQAVLRYVLAKATVAERPELSALCLDAVNETLGDGVLDGLMDSFSTSYTPVVGSSRPWKASCESYLLQLALDNPALKRQKNLYLEAQYRDVQQEKAFNVVFETSLDKATQTAAGTWMQNLTHLLREPMNSSPDDIAGQLQYVVENWSDFLSQEILDACLRSGDILEEGRRMRGIGPGSLEPLRFAQEDWHSAGAFGQRFGKHSGAYQPIEAENFTPDRDWMSNVVLIAKQTYVWLDQLSAEFGRSITRLDQIPDEALQRLARWGFSGLWLIGLWERSPASAAIKQRMGNPDAVSSAYALKGYRIADALGGQHGYEILKSKADRYGLRLAADMVPNHLGLDADWVIERPDLFLQVSDSPYPNYRFDGPDLCEHPNVGVFLEDGYWNRNDAAVVFKRVDYDSGHVRYIYHGNDGTQMPWNDTAQLDYLNKEARDAVIDTIMAVASQFPIIRFDAAMTLAKKHVQRLWFPPPGQGGAIPSRSAHGLRPEDFEAAMPEEFWRQVVDRINRELPDTLLIAEAFWLMEGYFVRSLGMHRVYNSAFMNMLKREDNANYRMTIKNTVAFSPEVLERFVNFMNNPDEEPAALQFGTTDKYLGNAVLMVTLPGLPMFGHGQVEGFREKYGMEYARARWNEEVDTGLVGLHEFKIFPLMRRRRLFSGVSRFAFYDFWTPGGHVDENVFSHSNAVDDERALVFYNNAHNFTEGVVHRSVPINRGSQDQARLEQSMLDGALGLECAHDIFYACREHMSGKEHLFSSLDLREHGFRTQLGPYQTKVFLDFRKLVDETGALATLANRLAGEGVDTIEVALRKEVVRDFCRLWEAFLDDALQRPSVEELSDASHTPAVATEAVNAGQELPEKKQVEWEPLLKAAFRHGALAEVHTVDTASRALDMLIESWNVHPSALSWPQRLGTALVLLNEQGRVDVRGSNLAKASAPEDVGLAEALAEILDVSESRVSQVLTDSAMGGETAFDALFTGPAVRGFLRVNHHDGVEWFHQESASMLIEAFMGVCADGASKPTLRKRFEAAVEASEFRFEQFLSSLRLTVEDPVAVAAKDGPQGQGAAKTKTPSENGGATEEPTE